MFGYNSIAQSEMEDKLVLTVSSSASSFTWGDTQVPNWDYEFYEISDPSNNGSATVSGVGISNPITFPSDGIYKLKIKPNVTTAFKPNYLSYVNHRNSILSIDNWGNHYWDPIQQYAFMRCDNLDISASDCPNFTKFNSNGNLSAMFAESHKMVNKIGSLSNWDISQVTRLDSFFSQQYILDSNINIGDWDTSQVSRIDTFMQGCGYSGSLKTKQITKNGRTYVAWDTSNITNLNYAFSGINQANNLSWGGLNPPPNKATALSASSFKILSTKKLLNSLILKMP